MNRFFSPDEVISHLSVELEKGGNNAKAITVLMRQVLEDECWHEYRSTVTGVVKTHGSFRKFLERGLGVRDVKMVVSWIEPVDKSVADRLLMAWREDIEPAKKNGEVGRGRPSNSNGGTVPNEKRGQADDILARLKRDDPMTAQAVVNGDLTSNAAARIKGWRKPRILLTSPESVAKRIRDHYTQNEITELINHLRGES